MPWRRRLVVVLGLVTVLGIAAACDEPIAEATGLPVNDVGVPWQAQPFRVRDDVLLAAVQGCRKAMANFMPADARMALADTRGSSRVSLIFVTATERFTCMAMAGLDGGFDATSASGGPLGPGENEALGPGQIRPGPLSTEGGVVEVNGQTQAISTIDGQVGAGVASVDILLASGPHVQATTGNGWFAAWWPSGDAVVVVQAFDATGQALGRAGTP